MELKIRQGIIRACVVTGTATICGVAGFMAFRPPAKAMAEGIFVPAAQIATEEQIDRAITGAIVITEEFTREEARAQAKATQIDSGGAKHLILRFAAKQTCGTSGCLHVIINLGNKATRNINLVDVADGSLVAKSPSPNCLIIKQPMGGRIQDFDICSN